MSEIKLTADGGGGSVSLKGPATTTGNAGVNLKLPVADGSANQVLKTDGSGQLSFTTLTDTDTIYDDSSIRKDLLNLALQTAVDTNRKAYNLQNSFVDQFEDDTGIGTETNVNRNTGEWVDSVALGSQTQVAQNAGTIIGDFTHDQANAYDGTTDQANTASARKQTSSQTAWFGKDWGSGNEKTISGFKIWSTNNDGLNDNGSVTSGCSLTLFGNSSNDVSSAVNLGGLTNLNFRQNNHVTDYTKLSGLTTSTAYRYHWIMLSIGSQNANWFRIAEVQWFEDPKTYNATGTLIGTANTASSSRTKVSGVVLYKNATGTATIGTDFKIYLTCNGGTNWTEVTNTSTGSDFSTGVKTLYLNETTCTAGTDVRYKIEWANQSVSKVTELHGIGVNY